MTTPPNQTNEVTWSCRFHPTDWFHEVGCSHMEWSKEQLMEALITQKKSVEMAQDAMIDALASQEERHKEGEVKLIEWIISGLHNEQDIINLKDYLVNHKRIEKLT